MAQSCLIMDVNYSCLQVPFRLCQPECFQVFFLPMSILILFDFQIIANTISSTIIGGKNYEQLQLIIILESHPLKVVTIVERGNIHHCYKKSGRVDVASTSLAALLLIYRDPKGTSHISQSV